MNRADYHAARRAAFKAEQHAAELSASVAYYYGEEAARRAREHAASLRASLRPRIDWYWNTRNYRAQMIQRRAQEAVRAKRQAEFAARELAKLIPTGNGIEDAMRRLSITFGGRTAEQAMGGAA